MSDRPNRIRSEPGVSRPQIPIVTLNLSDDEYNETVEFSPCPPRGIRISNVRTIDQPRQPSAIDLEQRHNDPLRRTGPVPHHGLTNLMPQGDATLPTLRNMKVEEDWKTRMLRETQSRILKLEEEIEKLKNENSSLKETTKEGDADACKDNTEAEQLKQENLVLQERLSKANEDKNKEVEMLKKQNLILQQQACKTDAELEEKATEVKQLKMELTLAITQQREIESSKQSELAQEKQNLIKVTEQFQHKTVELEKIKKELEEEKVTTLKERKSILSYQERAVTGLKQELKRKDNQIILIQKLASETESDLRQKLSKAETKLKESQHLGSRIKWIKNVLQKSVRLLNIESNSKSGNFEDHDDDDEEENSEIEIQDNSVPTLKKRDANQQGNASGISSVLKGKAIEKKRGYESDDSADSVEISDINEIPLSSSAGTSTESAENPILNSTAVKDEKTGRKSSASSTKQPSQTRSSTRPRRLTKPRAPLSQGSTTFSKAKGPKHHAVDKSTKAGVYRCICGKTLSTAATLNYHVQNFGGGKRPFVCDKCPSKFITEGRLTQHKRITHPEEAAHYLKSIPSVVKRKRRDLAETESGNNTTNNDVALAPLIDLMQRHQFYLRHHTNKRKKATTRVETQTRSADDEELDYGELQNNIDA